jgi:glucosamine kinase
MDVVVGVDAGGSYTRAICVSRDGATIGRATAGGGSPAHNTNARDNIRTAIASALDDAGCSPADVSTLVAGIAGFDKPTDSEWAHEFIALPGIRGRLIAVNDTEVAHAGAFGGGPGIIAIAGTGSMIFGISDSGRRLRNDQYMHYAGAARHLSFDVVQHVALDVDSEDPVMLDAALRHWRAATLAELREVVRAQYAGDHDDLKRHFGAFAPVVTELAAQSALARAAIARLAESTRVGIELLAADFSLAEVPVVLEGGLACSPQFTEALRAALVSAKSGCSLVRPQASPAEGAALLALRAISR